MKKKSTKTHPTKEDLTPREKKDIQEHLVYPASEDIYSRDVEASDVDPENTGRRKSRNVNEDSGLNEKDFIEDVSGGDLDVPGSEMDRSARASGGEDEENDYYSLGGDEHDDLEEDKGE